MEIRVREGWKWRHLDALGKASAGPKRALAERQKPSETGSRSVPTTKANRARPQVLPPGKSRALTLTEHCIFLEPSSPRRKSDSIPISGGWHCGSERAGTLSVTQPLRHRVEHPTYSVWSYGSPSVPSTTHPFTPLWFVLAGLLQGIAEVMAQICTCVELDVHNRTRPQAEEASKVCNDEKKG